MDRKDLYKSFDEIDDDILERSETAASVRKKAVWLKWGAAAACLCLLALASLYRFLPHGLGEEPAVPSAAVSELPGRGPEETPDGTSDEAAVRERGASYGNTSDTYASLPELLAYLGGHETHDVDMAAPGGESDIPAARDGFGPDGNSVFVENTGVAVNAAGQYAYHIGDSSVCISRLDGRDTQNVGRLDVAADGIFICNDKLWVIAEYRSGSASEEEMSVRVNVYDISTPRDPVFLDEFVQRGGLVACWMSGTDLYLVTGDGACACGWSRLDDPADYYPALSHGKEMVEWSDDDISILGEPTGVRYSAVTVINGDSRNITGKEALYGDITELFYGSGWIAAVVADKTGTASENSVVYTFDGGLEYTGKIDAARIMGMSGGNVSKNDTDRDDIYLRVASVTKCGDVYRMLAACTVREGDSAQEQFVAIVANTATGDTGAGKLAVKNYPYASFTEILWEENRAVACVSVKSDAPDADVLQETGFIFAEFDGLDVSFYENELTADYLDSRVGVAYGSPLGNFRTLIPMGGGIYVRYYDFEGAPGGFDVFDFSDSSAPSRLYSSGTSLSGGDVFDYVWHVYDENTFGTLKIRPGSGDRSDGADFFWCVYTVDPGDKNVITFRDEYVLDKKEEAFYDAESFGSTVFQAGNELYYTARETEAAVWLG